MEKEELKRLVNKLVEQKDKDEIVKQLQKINECFLQNYIIKINDLKIYPVEVEIYYYNNNGIFRDGNCHKNELQQYKVENKDSEKIFRFGKLYFHRRGKLKDHNISICSGGFDVCVANSDGYFLSILIRSAYFNNNIDTLEIGINKIVRKILLDIDEGKYKSIIEKIKKHQKLEEKEKEEIQEDLKNLEKKDLMKIKDKEANNQITKQKIVTQYRIQDKKYFNHYNNPQKKDYDKYELNSFINDKEIVKKIYKDKDLEIREYLENKNLFKK